MYTGLALAALGLPAEARSEVEEAIRQQPFSPLASPAQRFSDALEPAARRERRFQGELRVGVFYDTNVTVVPDPSTDIVAIRLREIDPESEGELISLRLAYSWLRTVDWEATVSYAFLQTFNNRLPDFNVQDHTGTVGLTYRNTIKDMPYFTGIQIAYDFITLGGDTFVQGPIFQPFFTLVENPGNLTTFQFRTRIKDFSQPNIPPEEDRDATNFMVGGTHFFRRLPDFNVQDHTGTVGLTYRNTIKDMPYFTGIQIAYDFITLGGDTFVQGPIFQPFFTLVENPGNLTTFQFRTRIKDFSQPNIPPEEDRDATNFMVGGTHFFRLERSPGPLRPTAGVLCRA